MHRLFNSYLLGKRHSASQILSIKLVSHSKHSHRSIRLHEHVHIDDQCLSKAISEAKSAKKTTYQVQTLNTVKTSRIVVHPSQNTAQIPFNWVAACQLLPEQESRLKSSQGITKWHVHHHAIDMLITEDDSVENRRSKLAICYGF